MRRIYLLFGVILLTAGVLLGLGAWRAPGDLVRPGGLARLARFAGPLMRLESPRDVIAPELGVALPMGGILLLVRFPSTDRVLPDTFRCRLNGQDVTHQLTIGVNGVAGTIFPLLEGENRLEIEVYGVPRWGARFFRQSTEYPFRARPLVINRA